MDQIICVLVVLLGALTFGSSVNREEIERVGENFKQQMVPYRENIKAWAIQLVRDQRADVGIQEAEYLTCAVCPIALNVARRVIDLGGTPEDMTMAVAKVCELFDMAPHDDMCEATIRGYVEPIDYMLRNSNLTTDNFCGLINEGCRPLDPYFTSWETHVAGGKPPSVERPPLPTGIQRTKILQFTDIHLDLDYVIGKSTKCDYSACCREVNGDPDPEDEDPLKAAGPYGHGRCGLPYTAMDEMFRKAAEDHPDAKYIFLTGDYVHDRVDLYSASENGRHISNVTWSLQAAFPNTTVIPLAGNHEPNIVNMYPPPAVQEDVRFNLGWMYSAISEPFEAHMGNSSQVALFKRGGFFSVSPTPGLRLIILNTNLCYIQNFWLPFDPIDPIDQLRWFSEELGKAEAAAEHVYVLAHIPPGSGSCWTHWSNQYDRIINRYAHVIRMQMFGHTHNEFHIVSFDRDEKEKPNSIGFCGPSAVGDGGGTGFKVYYVDGERGADSTWELMNHETWLLNSTKSNLEGTPVWYKEYSASEDLGLEAHRPENYYDLTLRMLEDPVLFEKYRRIYRKDNNDAHFAPCNPSEEPNCVDDILCHTVRHNSGDLSMCDKLKEMRENGDGGLGDSGAPTLIPSILSFLIVILLALQF